MVYQKISFPVKDYEVWKKGFVDHTPVRKSYSCVGTKIYTESGNKTKISVVLQWAEKGQMEKFGASAELKEAMAKSGVTGPPDIAFQETEFDVSALEFQFETEA